MGRLILLAVFLIPVGASSDSSTVRVSASIASWASVWTTDGCAGLESNTSDAVAWADDVRLVAGESWCRGQEWLAWAK